MVVRWKARVGLWVARKGGETKARVGLSGRQQRSRDGVAVVGGELDMRLQVEGHRQRDVDGIAEMRREDGNGIVDNRKKMEMCSLVIPKKHAVAFFPQLQKIDFRGNEDDEDEDDVAVEAINLTFVDKNLKPWMFRYCYWKTCKSYVFTKEWYRFVKEKDLKVDDSVIFYMCQYRGWFKEGPVFYMIDIQPKQGQGDHADVGRNLGLQFDRFGVQNGGVEGHHGQFELYSFVPFWYYVRSGVDLGN
ncbi:hypothetical protein NE237_015569 [Protea cynaroides]|uniref:TF-B3 domain-containing protein n=1 Tax=Protea cynaroides TaxID=273540 RepID=A0A9Q0KE17_9MAGN|nr:hypothetical protein NE237_015569 [Protea cynaroides]